MELTAIKPATVSIGVARRILGLSRNSAYAAAQRGELAAGIPVLQVGKTYRVPTNAGSTVAPHYKKSRVSGIGSAAAFAVAASE